MRELNIEEVARIARMYIDGDAVENLLLDKTGHTDYDFDVFNAVKGALTRAERINPELRICAVLWTRRAGNPDMAEPIVCASALPREGWRALKCSDALARALDGCEHTVFEVQDSVSHYFPVYNSDHEAVGALEFLITRAPVNDI